MHKVLVVGSINMDLVSTAKRIPAVGETVLGDSFSTIPGGKGANQAIAAARAGASVTMAGKVGSDSFGAGLLQSLAADGVGVQHIGTDPTQPTGIAIIQVSEKGENTITVVPGANSRLLPSDLHAAFSQFSTGDVLLLQLEIPLETVVEACSLAKSRGMVIILNPAPAMPLPNELLRQIDFLIPNEKECQWIGKAENLETAMENIGHNYGGCMIVTLGNQGVRLVDHDRVITIPAHLVEAVDTVAAGDAFVGVFAACLAKEMPILDAMEHANAAAAISVTRKGAQPSLPYAAEISQFLDASNTKKD